MGKENNELSNAHNTIWKELVDGIEGKTVEQDRFIQHQVELLNVIYASASADGVGLVTEEMKARQNTLNQSTYRLIYDQMQELDQTSQD